jgi:diguanylate cyclase (GGDEF)-like protein
MGVRLWMNEATTFGAGTPRHRGAGWRWSLATFVVVILWMAMYFASRMLEYEAFASLWFPPAAVSFAAFMVFRWRAWPALILANVLGAIATFHREGVTVAGSMLVDGVLFALAHCIAYWLAAEAVLQSIPRNSAPSMARTVGAFLFGGMISALIASVAGAWVTVSVGLVPTDGMWPLVLPWLIGDYAGLIATGPLLVLVLRRFALRAGLRIPHRLYAFDDLPRPQRNARSFALKLFLVLGVVSLSLLAIAQAPDNKPLLFIVFIAIVLQLWIVHTQGVTESLISIALFSLTLVLLVYALGLGEHALTLQFALITLAAGSYFGIAVPMLYADNAQLRRLLIQDALTGAYNRHFFVELSQQAIRQSRIRAQSVSMLMIDLDNLKRINDRHGHAAGDQALSQIVRICQQSLASNDVLGRLGGDEFCALLPGQDPIAAAATASRLIDAVRAEAYTFSSELKPSLSIGIATMQNDADDYDSLWLRADSALYVAKRNGRNQIAQEETESLA